MFYLIKPRNVVLTVLSCVYLNIYCLFTQTRGLENCKYFGRKGGTLLNDNV
jgi:hypothetical protein